MPHTRRDVLLSVPLMIGMAGCSAVTGSKSSSLQVLIYNASEEVQPLEYSITKGNSTISSASIQVAPTPGGNHYTLQSNAPSLRQGDDLEIEVILPNTEVRATASLTLQCSDDCVNSFTIRISQGGRVSVNGIN